MGNPFIVVCDGMDVGLFERLRGTKGLTVHPKSRVSPVELKELLPVVQGLVVRSRTKVTAEIVAQSPKLKFVVRAGEGTDNIHKAACQAKGVRVSNTPGTGSNGAAEHTLALMMTVLRHTALAHRSVMEGRWEKNLFMGMELAQKTVGLIGFGKIGLLVAKRLSGFNPVILFFDPAVTESPLPYAKKISSIEEVFKRSDIVSLHLPLTVKTKGIIGEKFLKSMPPHGIFINVSRGGIVDEKALYGVLSNGQIRGAGVDVFSHEPLEDNSPLRHLNNVVLTPHLGASTEESQKRSGEMVIAQIEEFFSPWPLSQ